MTDVEYDSDDDTHTRMVERTIAGGGTITVEIETPRERSADGLQSRIETTIEMHSAMFFNYEPREEVGTKRASTEYQLTPIREAVEAVNDSPTFGDTADGDVAYVVRDGYYPDDYEHLIAVTDVSPAERHRAFLTIQSQLVSRGYAVNAVKTDDEGRLTHLHVVSMLWVYDARSHGRKIRDDRDA